jgi:PAS domain S-box-containing protein
MNSTLITTKAPANNPGVVLIVDDSEDNRLLLSSQLKMQGYEILQAEDGAEGIEMVRRERPDLVLLDIMMPGMSGFEVCSQLKSDPQTAGIPIIIVTALREVEYRIQGIEAGADEFLSRPHHREELLVRVRSLLQLKRARDGLEEERNRLELLYEVTRATMSQLNLQQMMVEILNQTLTAVNAAKGSILLLNESGEVTDKILIRVGKVAEIETTVTPEVVSRGLAGWLIRHNQGSIIEDASQDSRWVVLPDDVEPAGSVIGVPLSRADRIVGVLMLIHPRKAYFLPEHLALVETIGAQATAAIENAYLFSEINEQRRKLEAILAQSNDAIITTDELWQITLLNQAAERFFELKARDVIGQTLRGVDELEGLVPLFVRATSRPVAQEFSFRSKHLFVSITPIHGVGFLAVMQDITELKRVEELRLAQERSEKEKVKQTFARYMGPRLIDHVLSTEPGLLARRERRLAVVMFADLRGSTPLILNVEANAAIATLNEFFASMTDIVYQYDGTIFDLVGDELLVGFNVPFDQADAARRALLTAIAMQNRFDRLRQKWHSQFGTELGLGIGIDQGEVVVGNVGAETRMNFAMVGEAVNTGHRLVEIAEDGQLIISEVVFKAVLNNWPDQMGTISFQSMGPVSLKGKSTPQVLYRIQLDRTPLGGRNG